MPSPCAGVTALSFFSDTKGPQAAALARIERTFFILDEMCFWNLGKTFNRVSIHLKQLVGFGSEPAGFPPTLSLCFKVEIIPQ